MGDLARASLGLSRALRLRQKRDFDRIRQEGGRMSKGCLIANWKVLPAGSAPRLGVITSRKIGKAHVRSRARRLLREAFRLHQHDFREPMEVVLIARASIVGRGLSDVDRDYLSLLRQACLLKAAD
jgi:ribonuclease P protein component